MNKINGLFKQINSGNKEAINSFIVASRQYVLNTARCFVNDDNDAINIAKKVYENIIFNSTQLEKEEVSQYLYKLIKNEADNYSSKKLELVDLSTADNKKFELEIDDNKYSKYYNDPKVERVLYDTIGNLPKEEKDIIIRYYFGQESIEDIADSYNVSQEIINKYINNANEIIEKTSKPLFVKYKIETADYSNVAIIYSVVKKCISIVNLDVLGLTADGVKDAFTKNDKEDKKDLKSFVKDILEDLVQDWFLDRIKSVLAAASLGATSTVFASTTQGTAKSAVAKGVAKKAGASLAKKIVLGTVATGVAVTGGIVANNVIQTKNNAKIVENTAPVISANMPFASVPVYIDFYSSNNDSVVDKILAEFAIDKNIIDEGQLKAIEVSALAIGVDMSHSSNDTLTSIRIIADKAGLGNKLINLASSLNILNEDEIDELQKIINYDVDELTDFLFEQGYAVLLVD